MFNFREQASALIEAVNKNTEELQNLKMQVRGIHVQAQNLTELLSAPPKAPENSFFEVHLGLARLHEAITQLLELEKRREKRSGY